MPKLKLSNEELNNILIDYNNGMSMSGITKKYHHDKNTLKKYFIEHNINIHIRNKSESLSCSQEKKKSDLLKRSYMVNDNYFSSQNNKMAYFLGFIMADGNVAKNSNRIQICLAEKDSEFLELFYKEIGGTPVAHYFARKGTQPICRWECLSSKIKKDLSIYGIIPHKTGFAKIPNTLKKEFYSDFIRGYFDGDGSIWIEENGAAGFGITSHNPEILQQIIDYFEERDIPPVKINIDNRSNINYSFKYRKQAIKKIYKILYYDKEIFYLKRKFDKFNEILLKK